MDMAELCTAIEMNSTIFDCFPRNKNKLIPMLMTIVKRKSEWLRPLDTWSADLTARPRSQYSSLIEHLLIKYKPPGFFKKVREARNPFSSREYAWYLHIGNGKSLRTAPGQLVPLSKREAHHVMQAPEHLDVHEAFLWGKLAALGANSTLISEVMHTGFAHSFIRESSFGERIPQFKVWIPPLVRLFMRTPDADTNMIGPLIDFLQSTNSRRNIHPELKNQTIRSLTRAMEAWHERIFLRREAQVRNYCEQVKRYQNWPPDRGIRPFYLIGTPEDGVCLWQLVELCSQLALSREGMEMQHCVATYASRCASGATSIWSLRKVSPEGVRSMATIEVQKRNGQRVIAQARAHHNNRPDETAMKLIRRWAKNNSINKLQKWL